MTTPMKTTFHVLFVLLAFAGASFAAQRTSHTFRIGSGSFLLDDKPLQLISGEMHFARIPRECWRDRLKMARAMDHAVQAGRLAFACGLIHRLTWKRLMTTPAVRSERSGGLLAP